ncbi:hypothetical protein ACNKHM_20365 [Shigella sonnei]
MSHKPAHLLLVDDDPELLKLLGLRLTTKATAWSRRKVALKDYGY